MHLLRTCVHASITCPPPVAGGGRRRGWMEGGEAVGRGTNRTLSPPVASAIATSPPRNYLVPVVYRWSIDRLSDIALPPSSSSRARHLSVFFYPFFAPVLGTFHILFFLPPASSLFFSFLDILHLTSAFHARRVNRNFVCQCCDASRKFDRGGLTLSVAKFHWLVVYLLQFQRLRPRRVKRMQSWNLWECYIRNGRSKNQLV